MPSLAVSYNPYEAHVVEIPRMGAFADVWGARQESDIVFEDATFKSKSVAPVDDSSINILPQEHTTRIHQHNPYSITEPVTQLYSCSCGECTPRVSFEMEPTAVEPIDEEPLTSQFMPPPPPRIDTYDVITLCGAVDPDAIMYNMMMRWYGRVARVQAAFNPEAECPAPSPTEYNFAEWCGLVNEWWTKNFEHRQKKVYPTAVQHRGGYQPNNRRW